MAKIEERIVSMKFDNQQFKLAASETMSALDKLKSKLKFDKVGKIFGGAEKEVQSMSQSVNNVDFSGMTKQLDQIQSQWSTMGTISRTVISQMTKSVMGFARQGIGKVFDPIVGGGMNRARNLEQANFMLQGIVGDTADGANEIKRIMDDANYAVDSTAFGLDSAAKAAAQFAATNMRSGDLMRASLRGISGVASMTGSSYDEIANIFTTVSGNGRLMGDQLNQLAYRGINAASTLAEHFGVTEAELRKMVTRSEISFEDFATAMDAAFGEQAKKSNETYTGALANLNAALGRIGADVATPYLENMRDVFNSLRVAVNEVRTVLGPFIDVINSGMKQGSQTLIGWVDNFTEALSAFNETGVSTSPAWTGFFNLFKDGAVVFQLVRDVFVDVLKVLGGAKPTFIAMENTFGETGNKILHIFRKLLSVFMLVPEVIGAILSEVFKLGDGFGNIGGSVLDVIDNIASFLYLIAEFIRSTKIIQLVAKAFGLLASAIVGVISVIGRLLSALTGGVRAVLEFFSPIVDVIKGVTDGVGILIGRFRNFRLPEIRFNPFEKLASSVEKSVTWIKELWRSLGGIEIGGLPSRSDVSNAIGSMDLGSVRNIGSNISNAMSGAMEAIRNFDYSSAWETAKQKTSQGARAVAETLRDFGSWLTDALSNVNWSELGTNIADFLVDAIKMVTTKAAEITEAITTFLKGAIDAIDWGGVFDGIKNFGTRMMDAVREGLNMGEKEKVDADELVDTSDIDEVVEVDIVAEANVSYPNVQRSLTGLRGFVSGVVETIKSIASDVATSTDFSWIADIGRFMMNPFGTMGAALQSNADSLSTTVVSTFSETADALGDGFGKIADGVSRVNLAEVGAVLSGLGGLLSGIGFLRVGEGVRNLTDAIAGVPTAISGFIDSIAAVPAAMAEAKKTEAKGNYFLKLAASVGVLAGSLWLLSRIPMDELTVGLGSVMTLLGAMVGSLIIMDKAISDDSAEKINSLGNALMKIGIAVGLMAASIWLLGRLDAGTLLRGLAAALATIVGLAGGIALAGLAKSLSGVGWAMLGLAAGVAMLAGAFLMFKLINWDEIQKGLVTLGVAMAILTASAVLSFGNKLSGAGAAMAGVGAGLLMLALGLRAIANLDEDSLSRGLMVLSGVMLGLTVFSHLSGKMTTTAGALLGVAAALVGMALALKILEGVELENAGKKVATLAAGLALLGLAMRAFPKEMPAIAGSLMGIAGALAILIGAIWVIGNMDLRTVAQGLITLGIAIGGLFAFLKFIPKGALASVGIMAAGLAVMAGALIALAYAMKQLESISWETMGKAGIVLGTLVAAILGLGAAGGVIGPGLMAVGAGLLVISASMLVVAGAAWIFADAVEKIVDSMVQLSDNADGIKDGLKSAGEGITLFAEESADGLRTLIETVGDAGLLNTGALALLFDAFSDIPSDIGERMSGFTEGLSELQDNMHVMDELVEFAKGISTGFFGLGSDGSALSNFFSAFDDIPDINVESVQSFVDGIELLSDSMSTLESLGDLAGGLSADHLWGAIGGSGTALEGFFDAFKDIDASVEGINSFVEGISILASAEADLNTMQGFAGKINGAFLGFGGDANKLGDFFKAFDEIPDNVGEKITVFSDAITQLGAVSGNLYTIQDFAKKIDGAFLGFGGDNNNLANFFKTFDEIDPNVGQKIETFSEAIKKLAEVGPQLENLQTFTQNIDGAFMGIGGDNNNLANFFNSFSEIDPNIGSKLSGLADGLTQLNKALPAMTALKDTVSDLGRGNVSNIGQFFNTLSDSVSSDLGGSLEAAAAGMEALNQALPQLTSAIEQLEGLDAGALKTIVSDINDAFSQGISDSLSNAATAIEQAVSAMLEAATSRTGEFESAGQELGSALVKGIESKEGDASSAGDSLGKEAAQGVRKARSAMESAGRYIGQGVAAGIKDSKAAAVAAAQDLADAVAAVARDALVIRSPSRVFMEIGSYVAAGLSIGISKDKRPVEATQEMARDLVKVAKEELNIKTISHVFRDIGYQINDGLATGLYDFAYMPLDALSKTFTDVADIVESGMSDIDKIIYSSAAINPMTSYVAGVSREARRTRQDQLEQRRKDAKDEDKRLKDQLYNAEKAILDHEDSILDAQDSIEDARKDLAESRNDGSKDARELAKAERDLARKERNLDKARRDREDKLANVENAKQERVWYDANIKGYLAGEAFAEGTTSGLRDSDEVLMSEYELFVDLLTKKVHKTKQNIEDIKNAVGGIGEVSSIFKSTGDAIRDFERAFRRLNTSTSERSFFNNLGIMFDSVMTIADNIGRVIALYDFFEPFLVDALEHLDTLLPSILPMINKFAPALGAQLSQGLLVAIPQILSASAGIIAAVAGIGIFLYDMGKDQKILKLVKSMLNSLITFLFSIPERLVDVLVTMLNGIVNLFSELPVLIPAILQAIINGVLSVIESLPTLLASVIEALVAVLMAVLSSPEWITDMVVTIVRAILEAIPKIGKALITGFFQLGRTLVQGIVDGFIGGIGTAIRSIGGAISNIVNGALELVGLRPKSPKKTIPPLATPELPDNFMQDDLFNPDIFQNVRTPKNYNLDTSWANSAAGDLALRSPNFYGGSDPKPVTTINFTQHNTSPQPLTAMEIYRNTDRQLAGLR